MVPDCGVQNQSPGQMPPLPLLRGISDPATGGMRLSIKKAFAGATVFITGGSGYIGGMLIESLLRTTQVKRIYVLLRPKRGQDTVERAATLFMSPLFHLVRQRPELVAKVVAIPGDISVPGLGLSVVNLNTIQREVNFIIHSAADIRLEAPVQESLRANYLGTKRVLQLAARCLHGGSRASHHPPALRSVVHVSTCYTNIEQPRGSTVAERLYPLRHGEQVADAETIAEELLALPAIVANERAASLMARWNFPNTYCFGKRLTELMAARLQAQNALPMAIVRPSLVGSLAGAPLPGYTGNWAGCSGLAGALAIGIHPDWTACASHAMSVWDVVPGDVAAAGMLAAAAAVAQGLAPALRMATGCGTWDLPNSGPSWCGEPPVRPPAHPNFAGDSCDVSPFDGKASGQATTPLIIVHSASSTIYPSFTREYWNIALDFFDAYPPKRRIIFSSLRSQPRLAPTFVPDIENLKRARFWCGARMRAIGLLLRMCGYGRVAAKLTTAQESWAQNNDAKYDSDLFFRTDALRALDAALEVPERRDYLIVWRPAMPGRHSTALTSKESTTNAARLDPGAQHNEDGKCTICLDGEDNVIMGSPPALHPADGLGWVQYGYNYLAGLYHMLYGIPPAGSGKTRDGRDVHHSYQMIATTCSPMLKTDAGALPRSRL